MKSKTKDQLSKEWKEELDYLFNKSLTEIREAKQVKKEAALKRKQQKTLNGLQV